MTLSIATWNINSVRLRLPLVVDFLKRLQPDILCLQETKCPDELFPFEAFRSIGYPYIEVHGQKGYHGVATVSKLPIEAIERRDFCGKGDTRHLSVRYQAGGKRILLHNFYVPAGGDDPDPEINPKFRHKLDFLSEMRGCPAGQDGESASILVGDLNIAPLEHDVWSHKQLLGVVSHTPIETRTLEDLRLAGGWSDAMRHHSPPPEKLFTWWSYRARDWDVSDRGRRLDHIWTSANLTQNLRRIDILREARGWERPSDHVPVIAHFAL